MARRIASAIGLIAVAIGLPLGSSIASVASALALTFSCVSCPTRSLIYAVSRFLIDVDGKHPLVVHCLCALSVLI